MTTMSLTLPISITGAGLNSNPFQDRPHYFLQCLHLGEEAVNTIVTWKEANLPNLHQLILEGSELSIMFSALLYMSLPRLETLELQKLDIEISTGSRATYSDRAPIYERL